MSAFNWITGYMVCDQSSIPARTKLVSSQTKSKPAESHPALYPRGPSQVVNQSERETDQPPLAPKF